MAEIIYLLCASTSVLCAFLLLRSYRNTRARLLLWAALCFAGLAINNVLLFVDLVVVPGFDLAPYRTVAALWGMSVLVIGLVWEDR